MKDLIPRYLLFFSGSLTSHWNGLGFGSHMGQPPSPEYWGRGEEARLVCCTDDSTTDNPHFLANNDYKTFLSTYVRT